MKTSEIISAWRKILTGERPSLSVEIKCERRVCCPKCAARPLAPDCATLAHMNVVVSIDGLQPEHDARRMPATYDRNPKKTGNHKIVIHCTITGQMMKRPGHLKEFLEYWTPNGKVRKVWFNFFTPQMGGRLLEMVQSHERLQVIAEMPALHNAVPKMKPERTRIGIVRSVTREAHGSKKSLEVPTVSGWKRLNPGFYLERATDPRIRAALEWLQIEEVVRQPMHMEKLAMTLHISGSRLRHLFRSQIGMPIGRYVKLLQMQRARDLLENSFLEVKEICAHVGLNDVSHFSRDYKKAYQEAPSRTRAKSCKPHPAIQHRKAA